ncbi:MAG TPA: glycosyltransferase, partial [Thermoanaerobaculia bacterium]
MTAGTTFSVVLPTRDRCHLLPRAAASVLAQTPGGGRDDLELLVVDDASADGTGDWLRALGDPRVVHLRRETPGGAAAARNEALRRARGRFVVFLDDDDELLPGMLGAVARTFDAAPPEVGFLWCGVEMVRDREGGAEPVKRLVRPAPEAPLRYPESLLHLETGTGFGLAVRREVAERVGPFDEALRAGVDFDWLIRLGACAAFTVIPEVLVRIHLHGAGQVTDPTPEKAASFDRILAKHRAFFERHPEVTRRVLKKTAALHYGLGERRRGRAHALRMVRLAPGRLAGWKTLACLELFGTEALDLRRRLTGRPAAPAPAPAEEG